MKGAEFKCWREFLGLSTQFVAGYFGVTTRTMTRWEDEDRISRGADAQMKVWVDEAQRIVGILTIKYTKASVDQLIPVPRSIVDGMPPSYFRMLAVRVAERTGNAIEYKS